jgi:hypothetical protein
MAILLAAGIHPNPGPKDRKNGRAGENRKREQDRQNRYAVQQNAAAAITVTEPEVVQAGIDAEKMREEEQVPVVRSALPKATHLSAKPADWETKKVYWATTKSGEVVPTRALSRDQKNWCQGHKDGFSGDSKTFSLKTLIQTLILPTLLILSSNFVLALPVDPRALICFVVLIWVYSIVRIYRGYRASRMILSPCVVHGYRPRVVLPWEENCTGNCVLEDGRLLSFETMSNQGLWLHRLTMCQDAVLHVPDVQEVDQRLPMDKQVDCLAEASKCTIIVEKIWSEPLVRTRKWVVSRVTLDQRLFNSAYAPLTTTIDKSLELMKARLVRHKSVINTHESEVLNVGNYTMLAGCFLRHEQGYNLSLDFLGLSSFPSPQYQGV